MTKEEAQKLIDEQLVIRKGEFATDPLNQIQKSASKNDQVVEFQKKADDVYLTALALGVKPQETKLYKSFRSYAEQSELAKAMSAGGTNLGAEWVPTGFSSQLTEMVQIERKLCALIPSFTMTQSPYVYPISTGFATTYKIGENVEVTASADPTDKVTFTANKLACRIDASYELEEDSVVALLPALKKNIAESLARSEEDVVINGSSTNDMDADNTTATDRRRVVSAGLRKLAWDNGYHTDLSSFYGDTIGPMRKSLGKFYQPSKCAWVVSVSGWEQLSRLKSDATKQYPLVITADKAGMADYTMKTGVLGTMFGSPVILSEFLRDTMGDDGYGTGTKTSILLLNLDAFKIGYKGGVTAESFRAIEYQTTRIVATQRMAFMPMFPIASNNIVEMGVNITA